MRGSQASRSAFFRQRALDMSGPAPLGDGELGSEVTCVITFSGREIFRSNDGGMQVLGVTVPGRRPGDVARFKPALDVKPNTRIRIEGTWTLFKGRPTLDVRVAEALTPEGAGGISLWLENVSVKGFGEKTRRKLVLRLGRKLEEAIGDAEMLHREGGLKRPMAEELAAAWNSDIVTSRVRALLRGHGLFPHQVKGVIDAFGDGTEAVVQDNPWAMTSVHGIGFDTCDKIAESLGHPKDHPMRLCFGAVAMVAMAVQKSNTCLSTAELLRRASRFLKLHQETCGEGLNLALTEGLLVLCPETGMIYQPALLDTERGLAREIARLCSGSPGLCSRSEAESAVEAAEWETRITLDRESGQFEAAVVALCSGFSVITGGPGTGKSTVQGVVVKAAASLRNMSREDAIIVGAPTGRAAKRLTETTGRKGLTVHQMLEFSPQAGRFMKDRNSPMKSRLAIVDEGSMLDTPLALRLFEAVRSDASIVLVGDVDQLPSVGPGQVLKDLIEAGVVPVTRLTRVRRTANGIEIPIGASRINGGQHPVPPGESLKGIYLIEPRTQSEIPALLARVMGERISNLGVSPQHDVQVLAAVHKGPCGVEALNDIVRGILNPHPASIVSFGNRSFGVGDRVMNIKNDHARGVSNGDIGEVTDASPGAEATLTVAFPDQTAEYNAGVSDDLVHARVTTVHKSQGSEFPVVVVMVPDDHSTVDRNLLYTAVTRAKVACVIIGTRMAVANAAARVGASTRITGLRIRLQSLLPPIQADFQEDLAA